MSQHEHDRMWFEWLEEIENSLDVEVHGRSDLQAIFEGRFGSPGDVMWIRQREDQLRHGGFLPSLPRRRNTSGGVRNGDPRGPASPRRGSLGVPSHGRFPGTIPPAGGHPGGAFGGGGGRGRGGHNAGRRGGRGAPSWGGVSRPATERSPPPPGGSRPARRATLPATPATKRYGDAEDMADRANGA